MNSRIRSAVYLLVPAEFSFNTIMSKEKWRYGRHVRFFALQEQMIIVKINGMVTHRPKHVRKKGRLQKGQTYQALFQAKAPST